MQLRGRLAKFFKEGLAHLPVTLCCRRLPSSAMLCLKLQVGLNLFTGPSSPFSICLLGILETWACLRKGRSLEALCGRLHWELRRTGQPDVFPFLPPDKEELGIAKPRITTLIMQKKF